MEPRLELEALELGDAETRQPVRKVNGPASLEGAVYAGGTRLTDAVRLGMRNGLFNFSLAFAAVLVSH